MELVGDEKETISFENFCANDFNRSSQSYPCNNGAVVVKTKEDKLFIYFVVGSFLNDEREIKYRYSVQLARKTNIPKG